MRFSVTILTVLLLALEGFDARAAHTQARLLLAQDAARSGDTVLAGVQLRMDSGWHTYWKNPGDAGIPSEIHWHLPPGVTAGDIQWPIPQKLVEKELTTYIYTGEVVLMVPLKLARDVASGPIQIKADVSWLECQISCVPGKAQVSATLNVGSETKPSKEAELLASWQKRLPKDGLGLNARAWWDKPPRNEARTLVLQWKPQTSVSQPDFLPYPSTQYEIEAPTETLTAGPGEIRLRKEVKKLDAGTWPKNVEGVIVQSTGSELAGYLVNVPVVANSAAALTTEVPASIPALGELTHRPLWLMIFYAFLGGLILNLMPCVLPVIALKVLGFVNQAKEEPRLVRIFGLVYTSGVLVSFFILACLVIGLKFAGAGIGWGFQFKDPYFLLVMTVLVGLIALNLFGLFEITPGATTLNAASSLASRRGVWGTFFSGLLTTVLATSCSAPFLAPAVGFAFTQPPLVVVLMMLMVGFGLAVPYLLLSWQPGWLRFVPKPGPWMEKFKVLLGFPMLAAGIWLCSLLTIHYGERAWWMALFLVFMATAAWVYGQFVQRNQQHRGIGGISTIALLVLGYAITLEHGLRWREPVREGASNVLASEAPQGIAWQKWTPEAVAQARSEGRPVLVDFTAKWCPTCNAIVKPSLENPSVRNEIERINAVPLLANYTLQPGSMTAELNRFGRAGVPLVLVYPRNPSEPPMVFDLVTPGTLLAALSRAAE